MKKLRNDLILILSLVIVVAIAFILYFTLSKKDNLEVCIYEQNNLVYCGSLNQEDKIICNNVEIIIKKDGVYVLESSCKDKVCIHQGKINRTGQSIVCLPNQVVIKLEGKAVDVGI